MTDTPTQAAALPELLPCPFCGAQPLVNVIEPHDHALSIDGFKMPRHEGSCVIECGCGAGLIGATQEAVTARWNQRSGTALQEAHAELDALRAERDHWKANHDAQVERARLLIERTDMPVERVKAYAAVTQAASEVVRLNGVVQKLLDHCDEPECDKCGEAVCPHGEWLHFHHDGCPACSAPGNARKEGAQHD